MQFAEDLVVSISIFGANDTLPGIRATAGTNDGQFFGVSDELHLITRINIFSRENLGEDIDKLSFGRTTAVMEPGTLECLGLGLAGMGLARRRKLA